MSAEALPLVDTHAHIYRDNMPFSPAAWTAPGVPKTVENYLEVLDRHHVPFGVIAAMSAFGDYNDYTLDALRCHKRLRGTGMAGPATGLTELREMRDAGMTGIRFMLLRSDMPDFSDFGWQKLLTRLSDLGMHVLVLVEPERLQTFLDALEGYSALNIVIDHFGFPDIANGTRDAGFEAALRGVETGRVWVKMAAWHRMGESGPLFARALVERVGPERLMWGTDWPFLAAQAPHTYADAIHAFEASVPDAGVRRRICETALQFYFY